jgi:hypothetical protein
MKRQDSTNLIWTEVTPWTRILFELTIDVQLVKKYAVFYGTQRFH